MSTMLRLELVGLVLFSCTQILTEHRRDFVESRSQYHHRYQENRMTREVRVKQGRLRGTVVQPRSNHNLQSVDVFLGVPYAEPPVGSFRFTPPRSPQPWRGVRQSQDFAPVCPQVLPNLRDEVKPGRYEYLERHLPYLRNQSEDCLYLNVYAPHQPEGQRNLKKFPVMVFIHGESFEWNSGNPYDGTILSSYGNVVFVTINFRLGILGFLRPGIRDDTASNFGLLDQIAALLWLRENIAEFGGDPNSVTLVGHGTGAIFANLLLISPVANKKGLFTKAILMSGSALSADAIGKAPLQITKQVAHALNCPTTTDSDLALCLRGQDVETLLNVKIHKPKYVPAFAPLIDNAVIPDKPLNLMENAQLIGRFDLMYGVTESEKFHVLPPVALLHGMLDGQRDEILRDHAKATHELEPELILSNILHHYGDFSAGYSAEYATKNRDLVLEALSDSGTVAPLIMAANLHSKANPKSYMYVFSHPKAMQDYSGQQRQRTVHGEELPYVLGVPLDGGKYDLRGRYSAGEILFSEAIMNWWCSFAYVGNPNVAKKYPYLTGSFKEWEQYDIDWPEYDPVNQTYFNLTIPSRTGSHYRAAEMQFWNEDLPTMLRHPNKEIPLASRPKGPRPDILDKADGVGKYANGTFDRGHEIYGARHTTNEPPTFTGNIYGKPPFSMIVPTNSPETTTPDPNAVKSSSVITMVIGFGVVFLLINLTAFFYLYRKRHIEKGKQKSVKRRESQKDESQKRAKNDKQENHYGELGYKSDSKPDLNDVIKNDKAYDNNSNFGRRSKLSRQNSNSTIDTHIKVREWIQQEIVHRCSPRFLRKTRETLQKEHQEKLTKQQQDEQDRLEQENPLNKSEPIYDESPALIVRPGKKSKLPKVSVAIDATPATRTESILNQIPIELAKDNPSEPYESFNFECQPPSQVVVIEHHHSRSDPLPMESVLRNVKPNFSTPRIYESDSGSASSLYAKINPKMKSRLPRPENVQEEAKESEMEDVYVKGPKLTTFTGGAAPACDVNVTSRDPVVERECVSPEEALRTIKRRNYPKVLPDIEKRRSLPAPSSLFIPKHHGNSLKDYKTGFQAGLSSSQPPLPPPRLFGASKSLDFAEESETQNDREPITTNLHVGPLKRQDPNKNNSDPSIIDSVENNMLLPSYVPSGSVDTIYSNPKCPIHGMFENSQSLENHLGMPNILESGIGNPNWYRPLDRNQPQNCWEKEPKIVITPRVANLLGSQAEMQMRLENDERIGRCADHFPRPEIDKDQVDSRSKEPKIIITPRIMSPVPGLSIAKMPSDHFKNTGSAEGLETNSETLDSRSREPRIVITPRITSPAPGSNMRMPNDFKNPGSSERLESSLDSVDLKTNDPTILISPRITSPVPGSSSVQKIDNFVNSSEKLEFDSHDRSKEPRIIITPRDPKINPSGIKQPKIIIKPTTLQRNRDQRNIPKVSAIPPPEKSMQNVYLDRERIEKLPLREKPRVTRIPSFSRRKEGELNYAEKAEIVQRVEAVPTNVTGVPFISGTDKESPMAQKEAEKTVANVDSGHSSSNNSCTSSNSNTGTVKRKPSRR